MHVVAGPPGGGKSTVFSVKESGFDYSMPTLALPSFTEATWESRLKYGRW